MAKKRTIDEYRQVKDANYVAPVSHSKKETIKHKFTDTGLVNYIENFLLDTIYNDYVELPQSLLDEVSDYVKK